MSTRDKAPIGSPCWVDLWTSDVEGSRTFYGELFGWESEEPNPEFGGYFNFTCHGVMTAGGMGDMGDMAATNTWKVYLATDDIVRTLAAAESAGAHIISPASPVADLGIQVVLTDLYGANFGAWQPGTFQGFGVMGEHGAPSWFELHTRNHTGAVEFYRSVFQWENDTVSDSDEFRYTTMRNPDGEGELAGVVDNSVWMPDGAPAFWAIYWEVEDADATITQVQALGGSVVEDAQDTPYGRLANVVDPAGAEFKLRQSPQ